MGLGSLLKAVSALISSSTSRIRALAAMGVEGRGSFSYTKPKPEGSPKVSAFLLQGWDGSQVSSGWLLKLSGRKDVGGQRKHQSQPVYTSTIFESLGVMRSLPSCMSSYRPQNPFLALGGTRANIKRLVTTWRGSEEEQDDLGQG